MTILDQPAELPHEAWSSDAGPFEPQPVRR